MQEILLLCRMKIKRRLIIIEERLNELENKYDNLENMIRMVDEYSRHITNQTIGLLGIMVTVATAVILVAAYFMIKNIINHKVEKEIEGKVIKILSEKQPVFYARGSNLPDNNRIVLPNTLKGIDDLEPRTIMIVDAKPEHILWDGAIELNPELVINGTGDRELVFRNYHGNHGKITWALTWVRKNYNNF